MEYSTEQALYIRHPVLEETKLLATAGSGKTFSVIHRISHMISHLDASPKSIMMFTFSKHAQKDFCLKVRKSKLPKLDDIIISTIDAFALDMLGEDGKSMDVSVFSYAFLIYLKERSFEPDKLSRMQQLKDIFVDEAQDLNPTQHSILMALRDQFGCRVHMIGDPNQNIYQFRKSTDRFLIDFSGKSFFLTTNYRSSKHIVEFCNYLRPYDTMDVTASSTQEPRQPITCYAMFDYDMFERYLVNLITRMQRYTSLHKIAILAPTRGTHYCPSSYRGLCYVAHVLYSNSIKFKQFYSDVGSDLCEESTKSDYKVKKDHISLLTMTASKGLEWDYVILIDVNNYLISPVEYSEEKLNAEKYLLYVAASRPRKNLFIFTKKDVANPWLPDPNAQPPLYTVKEPTDKYFKIANKSDLKTIPRMETRSVTKLIRSLQEDELFHITEKFKFNLVLEIPINEQYEWKPPTMDVRLRPLFGLLMENLFYVHLTGKPYKCKDITNAVNNKLIYVHKLKFIYWYKRVSKEHMTWELYDEQVAANRIIPEITKIVSDHFDRSIPFDMNTLVSKYYYMYIANNLSYIKQKYDEYLADPTNTYLLFVITAIDYAINTMNYYYFNLVDDFYNQIVVKTEIEEACFDAIKLYARSFPSGCQVQARIDHDKLIGYADFIDTAANKLYEIKSASSLRLTDKLQVLVYCIMQSQLQKERYEINLINLGCGIHYQYECNISKADQIWLINKLKSYI